MSAKAKPLLHLVAGNGDPELYSSDLHWFFTCYDAECGLKSASGGDIAGYQINTATREETKKWEEKEEPLEVKSKKPVAARQENLPYTDRHATFRSNPRVDHNQCSFTRGRRIWRRLSRISWPHQELLRLLYEPRRTRPHFPEHRVREAHKAYLEARP